MKISIKQFLPVLIVISVFNMFITPIIVEAACPYVFNSTNQLNKDQLVPGREGQVAPYVELISNLGQITLRFVNESNSLAKFEYRINGNILTSGTSHPVICNDWIYPGICVDGRAIPSCSPGPQEWTFLFIEYIEVRLALGGERDWDFDWVRFDVVPVIDIKPGSHPNSINLKSKGLVPVALLTSDQFDACTIDPTTVKFAGAAPVKWHIEDIDNDSDVDMLFHFKTQDLNLTYSGNEAMLTGTTMGGIHVVGINTVNIVPKGK